MSICRTLLAVLWMLAIAAGSAAAQEPHRLHSPEGRFTIELPRQPGYTKKTGKDGHVVHQFAVDAGDAVFVVAYFDMRPGTAARLSAEALLERIVQGIARNRALLAQRRIEVQTLPGREVSLRLPDGKILRQRQVLHGDRVYMWNYVGAAATQDSPAVLRYFESMAIGLRR